MPGYTNWYFVCVCVCVFVTEWVSSWATRITLTHETFSNTHTLHVVRNESPWYWGKQFWTSICVVQYSSPIGASYIHLLHRSAYMSHSPTTSTEWNTAPIKKNAPLETQMGYTCNMTVCLPISDMQWKCIFFTVYLVNGLVIVVHRLTTYISSDLNPIKLHL